ncbi:hypothetical protein [Candidatus Azobacteroides pseudotrichonymphae]|jgi:hypothetical protein|uniref:Uncharacterized protein n=1 Tax=Azobacteroides pseudotrichonymphae genomovar. CFP2 TaxID=511995 RepID=B6YSC0_AZOPC|nr:hypothetical protein [Candidatus Azobacteroides pseudotrichonymphae]BAG84092.1 conserved hypothetical protein [Candidatus Azobacteroides pseudotrichonymphae genomovar. CFP2]
MSKKQLWNVDSVLPSSTQKELTKNSISNNEVKEIPNGEAPSTAFQEELVDIHCKIEKSLRRRMRMYCADKEELLQDFIREAISERLEKKEK